MRGFARDTRDDFYDRILSSLPFIVVSTHMSLPLTFIIGCLSDNIGLLSKTQEEGLASFRFLGQTYLLLSLGGFLLSLTTLFAISVIRTAKRRPNT
jgi:hypothetical protein